MTDHESNSDPRRRYSSAVVDGIGKSASRAMLRAVGFSDEDFAKPQVGIASTWSNVTPCNSHIDELAQCAPVAALMPRVARRSSSTPSPSPMA